MEYLKYGLIFLAGIAAGFFNLVAGGGSLIGLIIDLSINGLVWGAGIAVIALSIFLFSIGMFNRGLLFCDCVGFVIGLAKTRIEWPYISEKISSASASFWKGEIIFHFTQLWKVALQIIFNFLFGITVCVVFLFIVMIVGGLLNE